MLPARFGKQPFTVLLACWAAFTHECRHSLAIGAHTAWLVRVMMLVSWPVAWPLARALDLMVGRDSHITFRRSQLKVLMDLHRADTGLGGRLSKQEVSLVTGKPSSRGQARKFLSSSLLKS